MTNDHWAHPKVFEVKFECTKFVMCRSVTTKYFLKFKLHHVRRVSISYYQIFLEVQVASRPSWVDQLPPNISWSSTCIMSIMRRSVTTKYFLNFKLHHARHVSISYHQTFLEVQVASRPSCPSCVDQLPPNISWSSSCIKSMTNDHWAHLKVFEVKSRLRSSAPTPPSPSCVDRLPPNSFWSSSCIMSMINDHWAHSKVFEVKFKTTKSVMCRSVTTKYFLKSKLHYVHDQRPLSPSKSFWSQVQVHQVRHVSISYHQTFLEVEVASCPWPTTIEPINSFWSQVQVHQAHQKFLKSSPPSPLCVDQLPPHICWS